MSSKLTLFLFSLFQPKNSPPFITISSAITTNPAPYLHSSSIWKWSNHHRNPPTTFNLKNQNPFPLSSQTTTRPAFLWAPKPTGHYRSMQLVAPTRISKLRWTGAKQDKTPSLPVNNFVHLFIFFLSNSDQQAITSPSQLQQTLSNQPRRNGNTPEN